ncbi:MAG: 2-amino-4-hydroxy-6-hydroxymethyldihydropteridine diphosphokinase [Bacteroidetes bacterium]|nr:2-amino-4-hydroxy-6-hydroxymethyldihydropteridine diphosphokinase [Rhodothermia bacterium]MCS7154338.1 2-amino-4-hydroxy-6-hydroxymethyldihydropteridine diphosphokinase [Bacteroidota bacterium]MCX7906625.1 2-amino-4-hydroxy-6-hydroxymethyldihydropteridine diphosphokinase [Bacteroidota bacterium]MDW8137094.1 2-amino-4-hydroxy-6-hydroxymethyldihydropteridine diphosphokinase [Bacteroidota bacterium]MDW8285035.1 2-amino-4-hydroxy-6-hydroxymethyldihydropteridine diphosphokinase [Bacteroidota bact
MPTAYIGVGSNLGDRWGNLEQAARWAALRGRFWILRRSRVRESPPQGPWQPYFYNQVWEVCTNLDPEALLEELQTIESLMGRPATRPRWAPRVIDLDLLLYETQNWRSARLTLPHPRMAERAFVLEPLLELLPEGRHPASGLMYRELLACLRASPLPIVDPDRLCSAPPLQYPVTWS